HMQEGGDAAIVKLARSTAREMIDFQIDGIDVRFKCNRCRIDQARVGQADCRDFRKGFLQGPELDEVEGGELQKIGAAQFVDQRPQFGEEDVVVAVGLEFELIDDAKFAGELQGVLQARNAL